MFENVKNLNKKWNGTLMRLKTTTNLYDKNKK